MDFWKINGAGNDFLILDMRGQDIPQTRYGAIARSLCERRLSVGADGVMFVLPAKGEGDFRMRFFNADGSEGEMCGNGARCICRYGCETGLAGETQRVETAAGLVTGRRIDARTYRVRLNDPTAVELHRSVTVDGRRYDCAYIELGVPHAVLFMPHLQETPPEALLPLARALRSHPKFPRGANVNFYEIIGKDRFFLRTFERGVEDFTYACGTGTGSTALTLALCGLTGTSVDAEMRGGTLHVDVEPDGGTAKNIFLTGPAAVVAKGTLTEEAFQIAGSASPMTRQ